MHTSAQKQVYYVDEMFRDESAHALSFNYQISTTDVSILGEEGGGRLPRKQNNQQPRQQHLIEAVSRTI